MTTNERFVIGILITILMAAMSWSIGAMSRISVLESQMIHVKLEMVDVKLDMKEHRIATERSNGSK